RLCHVAKNSGRSAPAPPRFPAARAVYTAGVLANVAGVETSTAGGAKFGWLGRFVNVVSNLSLTLSVTAKVFDKPPEMATVPGPTRMPTPELPMRPTFAGGAVNALISKYRSGVGLSMDRLPIGSGRKREPRLKVLMLAGSTSPAL